MSLDVGTRGHGLCLVRQGVSQRLGAGQGTCPQRAALLPGRESSLLSHDPQLRRDHGLSCQLKHLAIKAHAPLSAQSSPRPHSGPCRPHGHVLGVRSLCATLGNTTGAPLCRWGKRGSRGQIRPGLGPRPASGSGLWCSPRRWPVPLTSHFHSRAASTEPVGDPAHRLPPAPTRPHCLERGLQPDYEASSPGKLASAFSEDLVPRAALGHQHM